jgi:integrase
MRDKVFLRGGVYHCIFYTAAGKRVRASTHCTDRRAAEAAQRRMERQAQGARGLPSDAAPYNIDQALTDFVELGLGQVADGTATMYVQKAAQLRRLLGDIDVNALNFDITTRYVAQRTKEGAASGTVTKELVTLRRTLKFARRRQLMMIDVAGVMPDHRSRYEPRERWLTVREFLALLLAFEDVPHRQAWIVAAVFTGSRRSEVEGLDWSDIDMTTGTVLIRGKKTAKSWRRVELHPLLARVLAPNKALSGPVVGRWGNVGRDLPAACKRAGIARATPNDLRRTFASWLKQRGAESLAVARLMGHSSAAMVERVYGRLNAEVLSATLRQLPGCDAGVPEKSDPPRRKGRIGKAPKMPSPSEMSDSEVLRAGIEPATRGFSIPVRRESTIENIDDLTKRRRAL